MCRQHCVSVAASVYLPLSRVDLVAELADYQTPANKHNVEGDVMFCFTNAVTWQHIDIFILTEDQIMK